MKRCLIVCLLLGGLCGGLVAQDVPEMSAYTRIYDFMDELATDGIIEINSTIRPYSRDFIARKLQEARVSDQLTKRQRADLEFFLNDYALECDTLPKAYVHWTNKRTFDLGLVQPAFHYGDRLFKFRITPLLGMNVIANQKGAIIHRWYGANLQMDIARHVSVYASLRDNSFNGKALLRDKYYATDASKIAGAKLTQPDFLNNLPGVQYKEANYGGDYSDMRGGVKLYNRWGSIGFVKDQVIWGESYHCSNILSGRAPTYPMLTMHLNPVRWFEMNYFHAWLVSNVIDSTYFYTENSGTSYETRHYRPANKYMAATMLTFMPIPQLNISFGNSVVYAERTVQAAYLTPIAFYKSIDHQLTKGIASENQNSQIFLTLSTRNLKHLNVYASVYVDEVKFARFKKGNAETNPISWQAGFRLSNWPVQNLSLTGEFTRSNIVNYKHSIETLTWASNSYGLGHYLGDNAQELYVELAYKPIRSLRVSLAYTNAQKGNDYSYLRAKVGGQNLIIQTISQKTMQDIVWKNNTVAFNAVYEIFNNIYAHVDVEYNNAQSFLPTSTAIASEWRPTTAQGYLDKYTPVFYQGKNLTLTCGLAIGF